MCLFTFVWNIWSPYLKINPIALQNTNKVDYCALETKVNWTGQKYVTAIISGKNKEVNVALPRPKQLKFLHCEPAIGQNLDKMDSWHSFFSFSS